MMVGPLYQGMPLPAVMTLSPFSAETGTMRASAPSMPRIFRQSSWILRNTFSS